MRARLLLTRLLASKQAAAAAGAPAAARAARRERARRSRSRAAARARQLEGRASRQAHAPARVRRTLMICVLIRPWPLVICRPRSTFMAPAFTRYPFPRELFAKFVAENDGYFPVRIQALPEGSAVHAHIPVYQVRAARRGGAAVQPPGQRSPGCGERALLDAPRSHSTLSFDPTIYNACALSQPRSRRRASTRRSAPSWRRCSQWPGTPPRLPPSAAARAT